MKRKMSWAIGIIISLVIVVCAKMVNNIYAYPNMKMSQEELEMYEYGKIIKERPNNKDMPINSNVVSEDNIDDYVDVIGAELNSDEKKELKKEVSEREVKKRANYLQAVEEGYSVSSKEVDGQIQKVKELIEGTEDEKIIQAYCKGAGITEEEYWSEMETIYKENMMIYKYKVDCQERIMEEMSTTASTENASTILEKKMKEIEQKNVEKFDVKLQ